MKVRLLSLFLLLASSIITYAQKGVNHELPNRIFLQGKVMFIDKNYVGAQNSLLEFKRIAKDKQLISEADYIIAISDYFRGKEYSIESLHDYLEAYPETYHRDDITFYIGSYYFGQKDWNKSLFWLNQADVAYLSYSDQEDYTFRSAFANLQMGNRTQSYQQFDILSRNSNKYFEAATYYKAYIDFQEARYDNALRIFERLKNSPEFSEQSLFFITQGLFLKNDLSGAINAGKSYLEKYQSNNNTAEIYRILGNSYYRLNDIEQSINYYEKYLTLNSKPFREDAFQLGTGYSQKGMPQKAIQALQFAASKDDKLGQAAYMLLGQNFLKTDDYSNALMAFNAASRVNFDPSISEIALYNYAMLVHKTSLSLFDQSITVLQRFLNEYPNSRYSNEINNQLASTLLSTQNYQAALSVINQMRSPGQQILDAKQTILFQLGAQDFIDGNYNQAIEHFNNCLSMGNYDSKSKNEAYFWRGEAYYRMNNFTAAANNYQSYISTTNLSADNYTDALYSLGYSLFNLKQYNNSLTYLGKYVSTERDKQKLTYSDALNRMGDCYLYSRKFEDAARVYAQAAATNNQGAEYADFQHAFVLGLRHDYNGKVSALDAMMRKYPNSQYYDDALYEKSRALVMLGREQDAAQVLNILLRDYPDSNIAPQAGVLLGQSYYNTNNAPKAIEAYKKVVQSYRNTEEARMAIQSLEGIYRDMNDISSYASYVNSLGNGVVVTASRQDSLTYLAAENVYMKGRTSEALNAMNKYLQLYPNGSFAGDAHFYIGTVAYENNDLDKALTEFKNTVNSGSSKNRIKALTSIAEIQLGRGNVNEAYQVYKDMERISVLPEDKTTSQLGILKTANELNNNKEVIAIATQILSASKTSPEVQKQALVLRAKAYLNTSDTNKAIADLQKAASDTRSINAAEAQFLLAETYYKSKSYDNAEKQVNQFMKQNTPHAYWMARAIIVLSDTYVAKGDKFQAKQYLESLKANYTGSESDIISMINTRLESLK